MTQATLLLWDIDGTILRTNGVGMRAMAWTAEELFGAGFKWDGIDPGGNLDPAIFYEAATINGLDDAERLHSTFHTLYIEKLGQEIRSARGELRIMPGIRELIVRLNERVAKRDDLVQGLLTGNYAAAAPIKLSAVGVDVNWFTPRVFGEDGRRRADLVEVALRRYRAMRGHEADRRRVIVIGDTPRDVACAKAHGCVAFGVGTGRYSADELRQAGADHAVADFSDASPLLTLL